MRKAQLMVAWNHLENLNKIIIVIKIIVLRIKCFVTCETLELNLIIVYPYRHGL